MFLLGARERTMLFGMADITLSQLVECTGMKRRTIQYWTLTGVLLCDPETQHGGPGVPRQYPEEEAAVALVLSQITRVPLQLRAVKEIAARLREIINFGPTVGVTDPMWWDEEDDGAEALSRKVRETDKERARLRHQAPYDQNAVWKKDEEHLELARQYRGLRDWAPMQISMRGLRRTHWDGSHRKYDPREDRMLELTVDDADRWQLKVTHADVYMGGSSTDEEAVPVWQIRFLLNLDRLFRRLPSRSAEPAIESDSTDGEDDQPTGATDDE